MPGRLRYVGRYSIEDRTLGKGNFAVVELATHSITKTKVAIKVIDRGKIREDYVRDNLYREARILAQLRHPNVVRLYETITSSSLYCLVTEYAGGGDLLSFVRGQREGRLTEGTARPFVRQLVSALHHLHERAVVHRDLKMENIMLDEKRKNLKIVDYLLKTHCGSPEYAAPELFITDQEYGPEVDIWSLGINMFAMVTGRLPFSTPYSENRRQRLMQQIQNGLGVIHGREMAHLSEECQELLSQLIEPSPELRLPLLDVEIHPWITSLGEMPFCPFQQLPKDPEVKRLIIDKMAFLLNVSAAKIEASVHEYRLDEVSAVYNLLTDQYRLRKGFWDADHTLKREVKRPKPVEVAERPKTPPQEATEQKDQEEERMEMRTPTVIGMVRPSQQKPDNRRMCMSADFELSVVSSEERSRRIRAKTATFPQTGAKTRPIGNATTANSVMARYHNFGHPSCARQPKVHNSPPASPSNDTTQPDQPMKSEKGQHHEHHQPMGGDVSNGRDNQSDVAREHQAHSEGDGPVGETVTSKECSKQPVRKIRVEVGETDDRIAQIKTNAETAHDMKVIDMVKYFNYRHGYIVKETALSDGNSGNDQCVPQNKPEGNHLPVKLCGAQRDQIMSETSSRQDVHSCQSSRASSPAKTPAQTNELLRQQMRLPDRPVNAHFRPHGANPNLQKTLLLTKRAWNSRFPQQAAQPAGCKTTGNGRQGLVTRSSPATNRHQCIFSSSRTRNDSPRARLHTPVATLHSTEDDNQDSNMGQLARQGDSVVSEKTKEGAGRNAMPQRLDWKRSSAGKPRELTEEGEAVTREGVESSGGINNMKKLQELMSRDNVYQTVPSGNIKLNSAKIGTPRSTGLCQSPRRKNTGSGAKPSSDTHKSFTTQAYKGPYIIMDRHQGQHQRRHTHPASKHDRVINLNQQHMFSLLQEASVKFEDSLKAERKKNQAVRSGDQANWHRGINKLNRAPSHSNKAVQTPSNPNKPNRTRTPSHLNTVNQTPSSPNKPNRTRTPSHPNTAIQTPSNPNKPNQTRTPSHLNTANQTSSSLNKPNRTRTPSHLKQQHQQHQQHKQHKIHGEVPVDRDPQDEGMVALQLGQRVQLVRGSLAINSKSPPVLSNNIAPERVFNVQASRDVQIVQQMRSTKNKQQPTRNVETNINNKEWDTGYRLERKVSDTIKRAGSAVGKTPDLLLNCT